MTFLSRIIFHIIFTTIIFFLQLFYNFFFNNIFTKFVYSVPVFLTSYLAKLIRAKSNLTSSAVNI